MLPEETVFGEEAHSECTAKAISLVLASEIDLAAQDQVEPVLPRVFRVAVYPF